MIHQDRQKLNVDLFYQADDYFARSVTERHLAFADVASAYCSDVHDSPVNSLVIRKQTNSLDDILEQATKFFAEAKAEWAAVIHGDLTNEAWIHTLAKFGFVRRELSVSMCLENLPTQNSTQTLYENMDDRLQDWIIPLKAFPASLGEIPTSYARCHELALQKKRNVTHLSLLENNLPLASLTLTWNNNWARIDDVATIPEQQKKGYATKLLHYALNLAAQKNCETCFLGASKDGLSIYQKLGFKFLFNNEIFLQG